ncbi:MAG: hypothetical protein ACXWDM_13940 [Nocardioides sp.]
MSGEAEVLDAGPLPRSRRRVAAVLALLLVLVVGAAVLDRSLRSHGSEQVAACRQQGASEIAAVSGRLTARTALVRPTVFAMPDGELRQQLLGLVSEAVAGADDRLRAAGARCEEVELLWHHGDLARRRDDCVAALEEMTAWVREVSRDGAHAFGGGLDARGCR